MSIDNLFQVLWVENDPEVLASYPLEAENYDLQLVSYSSWEEAEKALCDDYSRWDAIILDAKCQYKHDDVDKANRFLTQVTNKLEKLTRDYGRRINWYILSGQSEDSISDLIPDTRKDWDGDWTKGFYSKNVDRELLFKRISIHIRKKHDFIITNDLYPKVFRAIEKLKLPDDVFCWMTDLLVPIHFPPEVTDKDYNNRFKYLRQILEHIFRSMIDNGIVPPIFESHKPGAKQDSLNLSAISKFLANILQEDEALAEKYPVKTEQAVLPSLLQDIVKNIIFTTGSALHTAREKQDEKFMVYDQYLPKVDGSTFLLKSYVFAMCDLILWYSSYFESHPDKERNALEWDIVKKENKK